MEAPWLAALCFQIAFQLVTCAPAMQSEIDKRAITIPMQIDFSGLKRTVSRRGRKRGLKSCGLAVARKHVANSLGSAK